MNTVDAYLDEMFNGLADTGSNGRRTLAETEDHLRAAVADGIARGLPEERAEREAVARFGPPGAVTGPVRRAEQSARLVAAGTRLRGQLPNALSGAWLLAGLWLVLLGASYGVGGLGLAVVHRAHPRPPCVSCSDAGQIVHERGVAAGVFLALGLLLLAVRWLAVRQTRFAPAPRSWPMVAAAAFVLIAAANVIGWPELADGLLAERGSGVEQDFVTAGVALGSAIPLAVWGLVRRRRRQP